MSQSEPQPASKVTVEFPDDVGACFQVPAEFPHEIWTDRETWADNMATAVHYLLAEDKTLEPDPEWHATTALVIAAAQERRGDYDAHNFLLLFYDRDRPPVEIAETIFEGSVPWKVAKYWYAEYHGSRWKLRKPLVSRHPFPGVPDDGMQSIRHGTLSTKPDVKLAWVYYAWRLDGIDCRLIATVEAAYLDEALPTLDTFARNTTAYRA